MYHQLIRYSTSPEACASGDVLSWAYCLSCGYSRYQISELGRCWIDNAREEARRLAAGADIAEHLHTRGFEVARIDAKGALVRLQTRKIARHEVEMNGPGGKAGPPVRPGGYRLVSNRLHPRRYQVTQRRLALHDPLPYTRHVMPE